MGTRFQRMAGVAVMAASVFNVWFWEFIRGIFYERIWHMLSPFVTADVLAKYGFSIVLAAFGAWLLWHTRPKPQTRAVAAKPDGRAWLTSYEALELAEATIVQARKEKTDDRSKLNARMTEVVKNYERLSSKTPFGATGMRGSTPEEAELESKRDALNVELQAMQKQIDSLFIQMQRDVHTKLESGELVAKGFLLPVSASTVETMIPAEQWRFLRLQDSFKKATGEGVSYTGVAIAKR